MLALAANEVLPRPKALVFDCDGTLVDSERLCDQAWSEVLSRHGYTPAPADLTSCRGLAWQNLAQHYKAAVPTLPPLEALRVEYLDELNALMASGIAPFTDTVKLLNAWAATGRPAAIASNSPRNHVNAVLDSLRQHDLVHTVVTVEDVLHPKPSPDVYLEVARRLDLDSHDCLAIEDSQPGVDSARNAGMMVLAIGRHGEQIQNSHWYASRRLSSELLDNLIHARTHSEAPSATIRELGHPGPYTAESS